RYAVHRNLHSFPTRRSSDLAASTNTTKRNSGLRTTVCELALAVANGDSSVAAVCDRRQCCRPEDRRRAIGDGAERAGVRPGALLDRKSTRLNSCHQIISYAV